MALISKASLLMVPSTYEPGKLYNVLPSGNRAPDNKGGAGYDQTRADFDFDRGSNAAASRINSSGLIEKYRENVLVQSNQFDTTWLNQLGGTITSGQSGYDGSSNAWLISKSASNFKSVRQVISYSGVTTFSVYAKAGTLTKAALRMDTSAGAVQIIYDLSAGVVSSSGGVFISRGIENIGNGWYRIFVSVNVSSGTNVHIYVDRDGTTAGNIYIQNAQLESGLVATDYLNSTSVTAKAGVLIDLPRINFDANGENGALLLEPSRQQLITQSEYFGSSDWVTANYGTAQPPIITNNYAISPDGSKNATRIQFDLNGGTTANDRVFIRQSLTSQTDYYFSVWMKSATGSEQKVLWHQGGDSNETTITSEWQRFELDRNSNATGWAGLALRGHYAIQTSDILVYGFQVEQGSYATSYIPNHGTSGGVTRAADSCSVTGASDVIGQTEGTIYIEAEVDTIGDTTNLININHSTTAAVTLTQQSNKKLRFQVFGAAGNAFILDSAQPVSGMFKAAIVYKSGDSSLFVNGVESASSTATFTIGSAGLNEIFLGTDIAYYAEVNQNKTKQVALFKERLSDSELATLTTL